MRKAIGAALFVTLASASFAGAQFSSGSPATLTHRPVSTTRNLAAPVNQKSSIFTRFLPKFSFPSFSKSPGLSPGPLPTSGRIPSTVKNPFQPLSPFTPKK
jgi:hypothetical protein